MCPDVLAYLAGVIDSDGTIGIRRMTYSMRVTKDCKQPTFSERVCLKQVSPEAVMLAKKTFGGTYYYSPPSLKKGKHLHTWQVTDKKAAVFLLAILPYLRIKKQQAKNCLLLRELKNTSKKLRVAPGRGHVGSAPRPVYISEKMEFLYNRAHELNRVGV